MNTSLIYLPRLQFWNLDAKPLDSGLVQFYAAGTTTPKAVYSNQDGTSPLTEMVLSAAGFAPFPVWYGEGQYKMVVSKLVGNSGPPLNYPIYSEIWSVDNIDGAKAPSMANQQNVLFISSVIDLPQVDSSEYNLVFCAGYYGTGDLGGGWFWFNPFLMIPDDGGAIISPASGPASGRWVRIFDATGMASIAQWGAIPQPTLEPFESQILAAQSFCAAQKLQLHFPASIYPYGLGANITIDQCSSVIHDGFVIQRGTFAPSAITATFGGNLTILSQSTITNGQAQLDLVITAALPCVLPEWWSNTLTPDWLSALVYANTNGGDNIIEIRQGMPLTATGGFTKQTIKRIRFVKNGGLSSAQANLFEFDYVEAEAANCFVFVSGDPEHFATFLRPVRIEWLIGYPSGNVGSLLLQAAYAVTDGGQRNGTLIWANGFAYTSAAAQSIYASRIVHEFSAGTTLTATGIIDLGIFTGNACCLGSGTFIMPQDMPVSLFGSPTDAGASNEILQRALRSASASNVWIDGQNIEFGNVNAVQVTGINVRIRNAKIGSSTGGIAISGDAEIVDLENCNILGSFEQNDAWSLLKARNCNFQAITFYSCADEIDFFDCTIGSEPTSVLLFGESNIGPIGTPNKLSVKDCKVNGAVKVRNATTITIYSDNYQTSNLSGGFKAALFLDGANNCSVMDNTIRMLVPLDLTNTGGIIINANNDFVIGLKCENNNLLIQNPEVVRTAVCKVVTAVNAIPLAGHEASVRNNTCDCNGNVTQYPVYGTECQGSFVISIPAPDIYLKWILTGKINTADVLPNYYTFNNVAYGASPEGLPKFKLDVATLSTSVCIQKVIISAATATPVSAYYSYKADYRTTQITPNQTIN